tara:strand:+ start:398 stop:2518 length:2121 start_codon:yes stop_codon:yes gene_type:complete
MGSYSIVLFSILLISSIIFISNLENSFADEIIATSTGFENSTILELKNSRGNSDSIDSVRIWLSEENEFKSFKTEKGWMGKNTPQGVIIFTSQKEINPGEGVKFGIKTTKQNPIINWKAVNANGEIISSATVKVTKSEITQNGYDLNESGIIGIKDESTFRFIPEKPSANSDFRVIGEKFVPNESLDFYIEGKFDRTVKIDVDGKIFFTSKVPNVDNDERAEFSLQDSGGNEKSISLRILQLTNREISEDMKLSLGNTPQQIKRGESIILEGTATPNTTLTITMKYLNGDIVSIDTIESKFDGKWTFDVLFLPDLELSTIALEISDGKTKALRNLEVISARVINIIPEFSMYESGDTVSFTGIALPNKDMSIILEDSIGTEIFSKTILVDETGKIDLQIDIPRGSVEGTYVLTTYQEEEEGITIFGVGQEPEEIIIVKPSKLNFNSGEIVKITIQGPTNAQVSIIVIDSADREKFSDTINLGPDGKEVYEIDISAYTNGSYTFNAKRGESSGSGIFTIGLTTGSGAIQVQTTRDEYKAGEQILILGKTGGTNVLLDITISDPNDRIIKKIQTFSDKSGVFKIDNIRIPSDAVIGEWVIDVKSGGNFNDSKFFVVGIESEFSILTDKIIYNSNDMMNISGSGARESSTIKLSIFDSNGVRVDRLNIVATNTGDYLTIWKIPREIEFGEYEIIANDGIREISTKVTIN